MSPRTAGRHLTDAGARIGIYTVPVQHYNDTADTDWLQALLLSKARRVNTHSAVTLLSALLGLAVFVMSCFGWLPGAGA